MSAFKLCIFWSLFFVLGQKNVFGRGMDFSDPRTIDMDVPSVAEIHPPFFNFENEFMIPYIHNGTTQAYIVLKLCVEAYDLEKWKVVEKNRYRLQTVFFQDLFNAVNLNWNGKADIPASSIKNLLKTSADTYLGTQIVKEVLLHTYAIKRVN